MHPNTDSYKDDPVTVISKVGRETARKLEEIGIMKVGESKELCPDRVSQLTPFGIYSLAPILQSVNDSIVAEFSQSILDYHKSTNPYLAKYGLSWEDEAATSTALSPSAYIKSLIKYVVVESKCVIKGTKHKEDWFLP